MQKERAPQQIVWVHSEAENLCATLEEPAMDTEDGRSIMKRRAWDEREHISAHGDSTEYMDSNVFGRLLAW